MSFKSPIVMTMVISMALLLLFGIVIFNNSARHYVKYHIYHRDYLNWKIHGGPMKKEYWEPFNLDPGRGSMIVELTDNEILSKFPFLVDGDSYPEGGYKKAVLSNRRENNYGHFKLYWFHKDDCFDFAVVTVNGIGKDIILVKG